LYSVTVLGALASPTTAFPNEIEDDESKVGTIPVPESDAVFGVFEALVLIVSEPEGRAPTEGGVTVTEIVQLELAASGTAVEHVPPDTA
jgi:hypothetical protein